MICTTSYRLLDKYAVDDLYFPFCGAQALLNGLDPYEVCKIIWEGRIYPSNPLTTVIAVLPFAHFDYGGKIILWSSFSFYLAFGLLKDGQYWRLLTFISSAYIVAFTTFQWSPLFLAIAFLPSLLPLTLVKPHIGLPVILTHINRRRLLGILIFLLITLVIYPDWPVQWLKSATKYDGYIPLLTLPLGPVMVLSLIAWRNPKSRYLFFLAAVPQRGFYDLLLAWYIPQTAKQMIFLLISSWVAFFLFQYYSYATILVLVYIAALITTVKWQSIQQTHRHITLFVNSNLTKSGENYKCSKPIPAKQKPSDIRETTE
jgi:hypothetical protein